MDPDSKTRAYPGPPLIVKVLLPRLQKRGVDVAELIALSRSVFGENSTMLWLDRAVSTPNSEKKKKKHEKANYCGLFWGHDMCPLIV